ncbi:MAG TPA: hypothetical protein VK796_12030 [Cytophaga sp.]|jgi:hypothetical protein|nr:hypothetical protein [Cytophaga sp.]
MVHYLILNGVLTLFVSVVGGFAFAKAIKSNPGREVAWRVVHSGGSMAGIMLMVFGCAWHYIVLGKYECLIGWSLIVSTELMVIGMFLAAITGKRGLCSDSTGIEKSIYLLYLIGGILCALALTGILVGIIFS